MLQQILNNLNIDPTVMLLNGVLFLALVAILNAIFWKPMMRHLDARKHEISNAYKTVDDTRREMENLRAEYQGRLANIEAEARGRIQETVRDAQKHREQMIAEARSRAEEIMREGAENIEREKHETLAGMRTTLDDVAIHALTKALQAEPDATQRKLVDRYIAEEIHKN
jgi:F-type H+-transporting ATPase subunit b